MPGDRDASTEKAILLLLAAQTVVFAVALYLTWIQVPFWDMLSFVDSYIDHRDVGDWFGYLWLPDNEHHSVWSRLLTVVEIEAFDGRGPTFQVFSAACLLGGAVAVCREFARAGAPARFARGVGALACMLFLTVPAAVDCAVPMNGGCVQVASFQILSLVLLDGQGEAGKHPWLRRGLAVVAAAGASFGNASGLLAWPILVWSAWRGRLCWPWRVGLAGLGIVFTAIYLSHLFADAPAMLATAPQPAGQDRRLCPDLRRFALDALGGACRSRPYRRRGPARRRRRRAGQTGPGPPAVAAVGADLPRPDRLFIGHARAGLGRPG
jgi:hypothetical protein